MEGLYVEYALSLGIQKREGFWKIEYLHPEDANVKVQTLVPMTADHEMIGEEIDDILIARPGPKLVEVIGWLYNRINRYPYYWPKEGTYVDKFGYDFIVDFYNGKTSDIEITQIAYEILKEELGIKPPAPNAEHEVDVQNEIIEGGGVLVKVSVTLAYAQPVSEFSLAPFTKYPMELASLMYEEDTETFHPKKEIVLSTAEDSLVKFNQSIQSIRVQFPVVTAKRITFVLRQQNHEKNSYNTSEQQVSQALLWNSVSQRATDGVATQVDTGNLTGWDIYLSELAKYQNEFLKWQKEVDAYKQKMAEREEKLAEKAQADITYENELNAYRAEYNAAVQQYKTRILEYQESQSAETTKSKYNKDLKVYNNYLRNLEDWKSKWS